MHLSEVSQHPLTLSFFSLVFWISLPNLKRGISLVILVFSLSFPRILLVRKGQKILGNFLVFLDKNKKKTKEKKHPLRDPLREPLRVPFLLSELWALLPLIVLPLELPAKKSSAAHMGCRGQGESLEHN